MDSGSDWIIEKNLSNKISNLHHLQYDKKNHLSELDDELISYNEINENQKNNIYKYIYILTKNILSYPLLRLRYILQIDGTSNKNYVNPISVISLLVRMKLKQGNSALTQGLLDFLIYKTLCTILENVLFNFTNSRFLSQTLTLCISTPFICTLVKEIVQSHRVYTQQSILDYFKCSTLRVIDSKTLNRSISIFKLIIPTVTFGILNNFLINQLSNFFKIHETNLESCYEIKIIIVINFISNLLLYSTELIINRLYIQGTRRIIDNFDSDFGVKSNATNYLGFYDCKKSIIQKEGNLGLYKGIGCLFLEFIFQSCVMELSNIFLSNI